VHADEKSDLVDRLEDKLGDAADALERLPGDSDAGAIDRARGYVDEARRYADELERLDDEDARPRRVLVLVGRAAALDGAAGRARVHVGAARPRPPLARAVGGRDARRGASARRGDVIAAHAVLRRCAAGDRG
jgi:hypothetical protein